jgi:hypothetical protein
VQKHNCKNITEDFFDFFFKEIADLQKTIRQQQQGPEGGKQGGGCQGLFTDQCQGTFTHIFCVPRRQQWYSVTVLLRA